ncbi:MAG: hypothetical protein LBJ09_03445 [Clostridiales bacterium]|jgi:GMP synthase PP-ATPase subunit|nr:hypothetical protein [Clostridiales bacterium]
MEIMKEIINVEKRIQSIVGDHELIKKKQEEKIKRKLEQYTNYAKNKAKKKKELENQKIIANQEKKISEIESYFYDKTQNLKSIFAINKDKWILEIFKRITESLE